jgi:hypothetical protein
MSGPGQCFISYSHRDHASFERLLTHLKPVAHLYGFKLWHDRRIKPGYYWNATINSEIEQSDIFVPLITNDFFASDYIMQHELPAILEQHKNASALLVPVIYRESCWRSFFGDYIEVAPKNSKHNLVPIFKWPDREEGFAVAANAISASIEDWFGVKPTPMFAATVAPKRGRP